MDQENTRAIEALISIAKATWRGDIELRMVSTATQSAVARSLIGREGELARRGVRVADGWFGGDDPRVEIRDQWDEEFVWLGIGPIASP